MLVGFSAGTGMSGAGNTAVGYTAMSGGTSGAQNTALGFDALLLNTSGAGNTAVGSQTMISNTTGYSNTASGSFALDSNTTGSSNTAVGSDALLQNTTGSYNTAMGGLAGTGTNTNLSNATAIGAFAEVDASNSMVLGSINGVNGAGTNTQVGVGTTMPTYLFHVGNQGTLPGYGYLRVEGPASSGTHKPAISIGGNGDFQIDSPGVNSGRFVVKETTGRVGIGSTAPSNILTIGPGKGTAIADGWTTYSSRRWKVNVQTLPDALTKVEQLRGVSYDLKDSGKHEIGVIAEEVGAVVPEVVTYEANGKDAQGVDYSRLSALLIEAVKQQQKQIRLQQEQVRVLRAQLHQQTAKDALLEMRLAKLERSRETNDTASLAAYRAPSVHPTTRTGHVGH